MTLLRPEKKPTTAISLMLPNVLCIQTQRLASRGCPITVLLCHPSENKVQMTSSSTNVATESVRGSSGNSRTTSLGWNGTILRIVCSWFDDRMKPIFLPPTATQWSWISSVAETYFCRGLLVYPSNTRRVPLRNPLATWLPAIGSASNVTWVSANG